MTGSLYITGDEAADRLLNTDANALLIGMLLDQQVPMEWAFMGPATLLERLGHLDPARIAAMDIDEFVAICCEKPAIHRFPGSMGKRIHQICAALVEHYDGDARKIWSDAPSSRETYRRLKALPGYGDEKSKIFVAILAKTQGIQPEDWREAAGKLATTFHVRSPTFMTKRRSRPCANGRRPRRPRRRTSRTIHSWNERRRPDSVRRVERPRPGQCCVGSAGAGGRCGTGKAGNRGSAGA